MNKLSKLKATHKILLHQGRIISERGLYELIEIASTLPNEWKLCTIGTPKTEVKYLLEQVASAERIVDIGYIHYKELYRIWEIIDATVIIYKPELINNRYCAPNRMYYALQYGVPMLVNSTNPVLKHTVNQYKNGYTLDKNLVDTASFFANYDFYRERAMICKYNFEGGVNEEILQSAYGKLITSIIQET